MENRIMEPSRATGANINEPVGKSKLIQLTEVTLSGDNSATPAIGQLDGTIDTP